VTAHGPQHIVRLDRAAQRAPNAAVGFNRQKMEHAGRDEAEKEARSRRALDPQILEDALRLVAEWNARQDRRMPHRRSAPCLRQSIGSCTCAAQPAGRQAAWICVGSICTAKPR
jgi:hypothetical protein